MAHETIMRQGAERPTLLMLYAAMMGMPAVLGWDERKKRRDRDEDDSR